MIIFYSIKFTTRVVKIILKFTGPIHETLDSSTNEKACAETSWVRLPLSGLPMVKPRVNWLQYSSTHMPILFPPVPSARLRADFYYTPGRGDGIARLMMGKRGCRMWRWRRRRKKRWNAIICRRQVIAFPIVFPIVTLSHIDSSWMSYLHSSDNNIEHSFPINEWNVKWMLIRHGPG